MRVGALLRLYRVAVGGDFRDGSVRLRPGRFLEGGANAVGGARVFSLFILRSEVPCCVFNHVTVD